MASVIEKEHAVSFKPNKKKKIAISLAVVDASTMYNIMLQQTVAFETDLIEQNVTSK